MNKLFTLIFLSLSVACFGQKKEAKDTLSSPQVNAIQFEGLNTAQDRITEAQKDFNKLLELIIGYKMDEIEWWGFKQGKFQFILKPKKK